MDVKRYVGFSPLKRFAFDLNQSEYLPARGA